MSCFRGEVVAPEASKHLSVGNVPRCGRRRGLEWRAHDGRPRRRVAEPQGVNQLVRDNPRIGQERGGTEVDLGVVDRAAVVIGDKGGPRGAARRVDCDLDSPFVIARVGRCRPEERSSHVLL